MQLIIIIITINVMPSIWIQYFEIIIKYDLNFQKLKAESSLTLPLMLVIAG